MERQPSCQRHIPVSGRSPRCHRRSDPVLQNRRGKITAQTGSTIRRQEVPLNDRTRHNRIIEQRQTYMRQYILLLIMVLITPQLSIGQTIRTMRERLTINQATASTIPQSVSTAPPKMGKDPRKAFLFSVVIQNLDPLQYNN